jgi:hypothetical protein
MLVPRHEPGQLAAYGRTGQAAVLVAAILLAAAGCRSAPEGGKTDVVSGASLAGGNSPELAGQAPGAAGAPRILVVYFSQGNSTKRVAEDVAALLGADVERIVEKRARKWGFFGFMAAGAASTFGCASPIESPKKDPTAYAGVVVCTPIWAWRMAPPIRSWLRLYKGRLPEASAYLTVSGDTDPAKVVAAMAKESGRQPVAFAGFADRDFEAANRATYLAKIGDVLEAFRRQGRR